MSKIINFISNISGSSILLCIAIAMAVGLLFNRLMKKIGLPNVTGYLIAGLLLGRFILRVFSLDSLEHVSVITDIALGFIAFSIGGEFKLSNIRSIGKSIITITFFQALGATLLVDLTLILFRFDAPLSITLGAIATATAPAATLMVVRQYKANGPVTRMLLPVVALDDAVGLIVFSISLSIAKVMAGGGSITVKAIVLEPLIEIFGALLVGTVIGFLLALGMKFFKSRANRISLVICAVFLGTALSQILNVSSLLLCMAIGTVIANLHLDTERVMEINDIWTAPLFLLFFVISGAELDLSVLPTVGILGVAYLISRALGKYFGAFLGSVVVHEDKNIRNYLGVALLPQAGVAIGMSQIVVNALPKYGNEIRAVVLCATLVYELVGPLITKVVLTKAGEIKKEKTVRRKKVS